MAEVKRQEGLDRKKVIILKKTLRENSQNKFSCKSDLNERVKN